MRTSPQNNIKRENIKTFNKFQENFKHEPRIMSPKASGQVQRYFDGSYLSSSASANRLKKSPKTQV